MDLPYYRINKLLWRWSRKDGARIVREVGLSMDKAPPSVLVPPSTKAKAPPVGKRQKTDPMVKMVGDIGRIADTLSRFKTWLDTPNPPKQSFPPKPTETRPIVPPFDIQEIPGAMRKEMMPIGAKLMERWFSGELNYSPTNDDQKAEINQNGQPYPESMIDRATVKLDWVLTYARAKDRYDNLVDEAIYTPNAREVLRKILSRYRRASIDLSPWSECAGDIRKLHRNFQFQRSAVDATFEQKLIQFLRRTPYAGVPDDLTAALGAFNFFAAIAGAHFDPGGANAMVTHIFVYVRDGYSFEGSVDTASQYLGHWSRDGVIVVPEAEAANLAGLPWLDYPVVTGNLAANLFRPGKVYYPVKNRSFREWQIKHHRGGDFIIYSDWRSIRLRNPIEVNLA